MRERVAKAVKGMVAVVLGLGAGLAAVTAPAKAQPWGYFPPPPPPPGWGYYPGPGYYPPYRPRVTFSDVCITSRGTCDLGRPLRSGTPCRCFIPGFGQKRGQVP